MLHLQLAGHAGGRPHLGLSLSLQGDVFDILGLHEPQLLLSVLVGFLSAGQATLGDAEQQALSTFKESVPAASEV